MKSVKPRNKKLEDAYFEILKVWRRASKDSSFSEQELKLLFNNLERAYFAVGYDFGDRDENETKGTT